MVGVVAALMSLRRTGRGYGHRALVEGPGARAFQGLRSPVLGVNRGEGCVFSCACVSHPWALLHTSHHSFECVSWAVVWSSAFACAEVWLHPPPTYLHAVSDWTRALRIIRGVASRLAWRCPRLATRFPRRESSPRPRCRHAEAKLPLQQNKDDECSDARYSSGSRPLPGPISAHADLNSRSVWICVRVFVADTFGEALAASSRLRRSGAGLVAGCTTVLGWASLAGAPSSSARASEAGSSATTLVAAECILARGVHFGVCLSSRRRLFRGLAMGWIVHVGLRSPAKTILARNAALAMGHHQTAYVEASRTTPWWNCATSRRLSSGSSMVWPKR